MSRDKQIEESNSCCNSCIHRFVCFQCDDDTLVCSQHKDERNYRKASDVARDIFEEIDKIIADIQADNYLRNLGIGFISNDEKTTEQKLADLKKKYEKGVSE